MRLRGYLIQVFKIIKESDGKELKNNFKLASNNFRGHSLKLCKPRCNLNVRKFAFSNTVVDEWNLLEQFVIDCGCHRILNRRQSASIGVNRPAQSAYRRKQKIIKTTN